MWNGLVNAAGTRKQNCPARAAGSVQGGRRLQRAATAREGTSFKISGTNLVSLSLSLFHMKVCKKQISK